MDAMSVTSESAPRILQLPNSVINKIAAGEVIERPASVIKELMENSIDALATRIELEIQRGGADLIKIIDDGEGIHPDDLPLAVAPHATSKLRNADDLFHVRSMGFRGEALASIAEISKLRIRSRQADAAIGSELSVDGGVIQPLVPCGCAVGTTIEVRELFYTTPVRRKFLKNASTEFGHISEQFTRIALANPNLHLVLKHNDRTVFELPATQRLQDRLELFYGSELAADLIPIEMHRDGSRIWGFVGHPKQSRTTRKHQYLFLNGRWIQDRSLQHALNEAYRGLLMVGRQPIAFLFLEVPPDAFDVNVHPTKSEVRFLDSSALFRLVLSSIRQKFLGMDLGGVLDASRFTPGSSLEQVPVHDLHVDERESSAAVGTGPLPVPYSMERELSNWAQTQLSDWQPEANASSFALREAPREESLAPSDDDREPGPLARPSGHADESIATSRFNSYLAPRDTYPSPSSEFRPFPGGPPPILGRVLSATAPLPAPAPATLHEADLPTTTATGADVRAMQVHDCYLVVETPDGVHIIDQHALHERIMYEQFRRRILSGAPEVQRLLVPIPVELTPREAALTLDNAELLAELGLLVQEFGGNTVALNGLPTLARRANPEELLKAVIEKIDSQTETLTRRDLLDTLLHMMACKAAIKAGQRLSPEEITALLDQRHLCDDHHHCPHGRPTSLKLSKMELDRQFGRLG
ncbi:MAG: DNA mismatch repair endonuclease MutL [Planctomycetota bacterium]|nr:MAG: DNA mismatch repair endonuclease MutL [Planctomycetota bacterium]